MESWIGLGVVALVLLVFVELHVVQQHQRFVIERFGSYNRTQRPGLRFMIRFVEQVRAVVPVWEMTLPLFEQAIKIDFQDGSATPKNGEAFIQISRPDERYDPNGALGRPMTGVERAVYQIANWRTAIRDVLENALRTYLNSLTINEAITQRRGGYDVIGNGLAQQDAAEAQAIREKLATWGFELHRTTIQDFDLEPELVRARGQVQVAQRKAEAAVFERRTRAQETVGSFVQMMAEATNQTYESVQAQIVTDPKLQAEMRALAIDLVTRQMSIDGKALQDVRIAGGGDLTQTFAALAALFGQGGNRGQGNQQIQQDQQSGQP